jgi:hypothetical protein
MLSSPSYESWVTPARESSLHTGYTPTSSINYYGDAVAPRGVPVSKGGPQSLIPPVTFWEFHSIIKLPSCLRLDFDTDL